MKSPSTISKLKDSIQNGNVGFVSSARQELPPAIVSIESTVRQISNAQKTIKQVLVTSSPTYCSYCHTLGPQLPAILEQFQFESVIHASISGGVVPHTSAPVINWQGLDGTNIPAFSVTPIDANSADGLLKLGLTIGEMLDSYHHSDLLFVHWPDQVCESFGDLVAAEKYGAILGRFQTIDEFNSVIHDNGFSDSFESEDYKFPYLEDAWRQKNKNPISIWSDYWSTLIRIRCLKQAATLMNFVCVGDHRSSEILSTLAQIEIDLDDQIGRRDVAEHTSKQVLAVAQSLQLDEIWPSETPTDADDGLLINATQFSKSTAIYRDDRTDVVRMDPFDIKSVNSLSSIIQNRDPKISLQAAADEIPMLRNEFFEVAFDHSTGGIKSVNRHEKKGNLFSQHLACRLTQSVFERGYPRQKSRYAIAQCTHWEQHDYGKSSSKVSTSGSILDGESTVAEFKQTVSIQRGDPKIHFDIELQVLKDIKGPPWRNYLANRIAWAQEDAAVFRSENELSNRVYQEKFTAPLFVEVRSDNAKLSLLANGLPFHRRSHRRMLDTLLIVENESKRRFQFSIAIDAPTSIGAAIDYLSPTYILPAATKNRNPGWLFHLNCKNILLTNMEPVVDSTGRATAVRLRFQETEGRAGDLKVTVPSTIRSATRISLQGESMFELKFEEDVVHCGFLAYQYFQIQVAFSYENK